MALEVGGKTIETTDNGYLVNLEDWTEDRLRRFWLEYERVRQRVVR